MPALEQSRDRWGAHIVGLSGLVLMLVGLAHACLPRELASLVGIALGTPDAATDVRATYGGLQIGLGAWLLGCWRRGSLRPALTLLAVGAGCMAGTRVIGMAIDGATFLQAGGTLIEALLAASALWVLAEHRG